MPETTRISELSAHEGKPAADDLLVLTDISDDSQSPEGSTKKITYGDLTNSFVTSVSLPQSASWDTAYTTVTANSASWASGGSGAYASNSTISDNLSFAYNFPDALLVPLTRGGGYQERIFPFVGFANPNATSVSGVWSGGEVTFEISLGSERFILKFDNDTNGTFFSYTEVGDAQTTDVVWSEMSPATTNQPTLKEFIDVDRAIYYR